MENFIKSMYINDDIKEIENILNNNITDITILKRLHKKIDSKYQTCIKDWGKSLYGWIKDVGFSYEFLDSSSLIENLESMLFKLSAYSMNLNNVENTPSNIHIPKVKNDFEPIHSKKKQSKKVFIVHGRDDIKKYEVSNFLQAQGLTPIILHEQVNNGQTIIEKIENNSDVTCAIILLTPDDEGKLKISENPLKTRARQNVIFEAGYFMGKLGRKNTILLSGVEEKMSDIDGIVYLDINNYKDDLLQELKAIDLL